MARRLGSAAAPPTVIVEHVDALRRGERLQSGLEILALVIDPFVGAMLAGEGELVARGGDGDDPRAHELGDLDRRDAGAAGRAEHRDGLAWLELGRGP